MTHIANWATHFQQTNADVHAAIGTTLPIMITEFNLDPNLDPRYSHAAFIQPWVHAALAELQQLRGQGLIGAMYYTATDNGMDLVSPANAFTAEGQQWRSDLLAATPTPSPAPAPPPATRKTEATCIGRARATRLSLGARRDPGSPQLPRSRQPDPDADLASRATASPAASVNASAPRRGREPDLAAAPRDRSARCDGSRLRGLGLRRCCVARAPAAPQGPPTLS
jgi:hypothetical protein